MANTQKRNSTIKHSGSPKVRYRRRNEDKWGVGVAPWMKKKSPWDTFLKDESSMTETIPEYRALGTPTGKQALEYGRKAKEEARAAKKYAVEKGHAAKVKAKEVKDVAVIKGKLAAGAAKYYGEEVGEVGVKVAESGIKAGKWYTQKLPKKIVDTAAIVSEKEPDYKGMGGKIDWGLGFGAKVARVTVRETRNTRVGRAASKVTGKAQATYAKGMNVGGKLDVIGSRFSKRFAPDSVIKTGLGIGKGVHEYAAWNTKTGEAITHSKYGQAYRMNVNVGKKYFGEKSEQIKSSKLGKFVGGSEAAMKYKEAKGKLSYARQHKAAATMKIGKMGAKGTAKFALANANLASQLIAQQDGVLAVTKPLFWSLKLVPYLTSAIVPILITVIAILMALMMWVCGWVSFGYMFYFLKTIPVMLWNIFATIINGFYFAFFGVLQLMMMGMTAIVNAVAYFFAGPVIDTINLVIDGVNTIAHVISLGLWTPLQRIGFHPWGQSSWNATPSNALSYAIPEHVLFNNDPKAGFFFGWPTLGSLFSFAFVRPGVPLYVTEANGTYNWTLVDTGGLIKVYYPTINPDARAKGIVSTYDQPPPTIFGAFDPKAYWTFLSFPYAEGAGFQKNLVHQVFPVIIDSMVILFERLPTKSIALGKAAQAGWTWGAKSAIYDTNDIPWAYAPEDLNRRLSNDVAYYVRGHGVCLIYNTNTLAGVMRQSPLGQIPFIGRMLGSEDIQKSTQVYTPTEININNIHEGQGILAPDYIFSDEPFFIDADVMQAMHLGKYARMGDDLSRLWVIHLQGSEWCQGDDGNLYPPQDVANLYFQQKALAGFAVVNYYTGNGS